MVDGERAAAFTGRSIHSTYSELACNVAKLSESLERGFGLKPRDRVAIFMKNTPDYLTVMFGCWWAGLVVVPINAKLHELEVRYILEDSGASVCFASKNLADVVNAAATGLSNQVEVVEVGGGTWSRLFRTDGNNGPRSVLSMDVAWLFYTSGTTGQPKGAMLTHGNLWAMVAGYFTDVDRVDCEDRFLHLAPMSHGSGLYVLPQVCGGAAHVFPESGGFDVDEVFELMSCHRSTATFVAPTMIRRLLTGWSEFDASDIKTIVYGGGPMYKVDIVDAMERFGAKFVQIYGQGESPMTITALSKRRHVESMQEGRTDRLTSVGVAQTGVEVAIWDEFSQPVPRGSTGEIVVRGPQVMLGYWRRPDATRETIKNGWLKTGDIGTYDVRGYLTLKSRSKDVVISGGSNIYPREVEDVLLSHEAVAEVAVVGRPHIEWGEEVVAFIVLRTGGVVTYEDLDSLCLQRIARFKRPRSYYFVDSLPKNNYGKVLKKALRDSLLSYGERQP